MTPYADWPRAVTVEDLHTGDVLLLSSDGLHGVLAAEDLAAELRATAPAGGLEPAERLRRAKDMLDNGLISDAEFESIKARVVDGL